MVGVLRWGLLGSLGLLSLKALFLLAGATSLLCFLTDVILPPTELCKLLWGPDQSLHCAIWTYSLQNYEFDTFPCKIRLCHIFHFDDF